MTDSSTVNMSQNNKFISNGTSPDTDKVLSDAIKDLSMDVLIRGETPQNIEQRCFELCQTYIGGSWAQAKSTADITVERISGGLTNQLYHVRLNESVGRVPNDIYPDEPTDVAIKLYQEKHMKNYADGEAERLNDIIILTIVSEVGVGPKVFGIFSDGVILAYHKHTTFRTKQQQNPKLLKELAQVLAKIHHLNVPVRKQNNWMLTEMRNMINLGYENTDVKGLVEELNLVEFKTRDLVEEFNAFEKMLIKLNAPKVFCHNDFRGNNILVTEPEEKILLCDLEYSSYGGRGFDLATFLTEWGYELSEFYKFSMPEDVVIENFVSLYIEACNQIVPDYSAKSENQFSTLVNETKVYFLANIMFFMVFWFQLTESIIPNMPFDPRSKMQFVNKWYKTYLDIKKRLVASKIIENF